MTSATIGWNSTVACSVRSAAHASSRSRADRAIRHTVAAPSRAKAPAIETPRPRLAPVTTTVRPRISRWRFTAVTCPQSSENSAGGMRMIVRQPQRTTMKCGCENENAVLQSRSYTRDYSAACRPACRTTLRVHETGIQSSTPSSRSSIPSARKASTTGSPPSLPSSSRAPSACASAK